MVDLEESATDKLLFFEGTETNTSMQIPAFMTANFDDCEVVVGDDRESRLVGIAVLPAMDVTTGDSHAERSDVRVDSRAYP